MVAELSQSSEAIANHVGQVHTHDFTDVVLEG